MDGFFSSEDGMEDGRREGKEKWWTKDGRRGRRRRRVDAFVDYSQRKGRFWGRGLSRHYYTSSGPEIYFFFQAIQQCFSDIGMAEWLLKCLNNRFSQ